MRPHLRREQHRPLAPKVPVLRVEPFLIERSEVVAHCKVLSIQPQPQDAVAVVVSGRTRCIEVAITSSDIYVAFLICCDPSVRLPDARIPAVWRRIQHGTLLQSMG